jgi:hypothetical protein
MESLKDSFTALYIQHHVEGGVDSWVQLMKEWYQYGFIGIWVGIRSAVIENRGESRCGWDEPK